MPIPRHSALKHNTLRRALRMSIQRNYLSEEMFWKPGFSSVTESQFCCTVSPSLGLPVCWLVLCLFVFFGGGGLCCFVLFFVWFTGFPVLWIWDAQVRRHFQDCHHRHDERSNGAKKTSNASLTFNFRLQAGWASEFLKIYVLGCLALRLSLANQGRSLISAEENQVLFERKFDLSCYVSLRNCFFFEQLCFDALLMTCYNEACWREYSLCLLWEIVPT